MLNNAIVFAELLALLRNIDPNIPLPDDLDNYLWQNMDVEDFCFALRILEPEGAIPGKAYYVVHGFVMVYGYDAKADRYVFRIYRANSIVALNCFMKQVESVYSIVACEGALVWSITIDHMHKIYRRWDGMEQMALKTALEYGTAKEAARSDLLGIADTALRVLKFYQRYKGLLPPRKSPIRDACIACFLSMTIDILRKARRKLKKGTLLKY